MGRVVKTILLFCAFASAHLFAQSATWNVNVNGMWSTPGNWTPTVAPSGTDASAVFGTFPTMPIAVFVDMPFTVGSMQFDNVNSYTIAPPMALTLSSSSGSSLITVTNLTGTHVILADMVLTNGLTVTQASTGNFTLAGVISEMGGSQAITIGGSQTTVIVNNMNSYSGGTTISSGILQIPVDSPGMTPLGLVTGGVTIAAGTFQAGASFSTQAARVFTLTGPAIFDANGNSLTIAGVIGGSGSLTLGGTAGTLVLSGANTYLGGTTVNVGILSVSSDGNLGNTAGALAIGNGATFLTGTSFNSARAVSLTGGTTIHTMGAGTILGLTGNITGSGSLTKIGAGQLTLTGSNSYSGGTVVTAGTLQGNSSSLPGNIANSGTLIFNQTFNGTYAGILQGAGPMTINGGAALAMTGSSPGFTGITTLSGCTTLIMNGNLGGSPLTIDSCSLLRGNGVVGPTINNGRIWPGNSLGVITVNGPLTFAPGSSLFLDITPLASSRVDVMGLATLTGGDLIVNPIPGSGFFGLTRSYVLLTATGGLGATTFASSTITDPNFVGVPVYLPNSVVLDVTIVRPFLGFPFANSNEEAVGRNIDALHASGILPPGLVPIINSLAGQPFEVINDALDQMHPAAMSALAELQAEIGGQMLSLFHRKPTLICGCSAPNRIWVEPFGNWLHEKQQGQEIGFHATTRGIAFGIDRQFFDIWTVGAGGAWNATDLTWSLNRGHAYTNGLFGAFYTDLSVGNFYLGGSFYAGSDGYDTARGIHFVTTDRQAKAHYSGLDLGGQITAAYYFGTPACLLYPYGTVDYLCLANESYTESGADVLDLNVSAYTSSTLRSEAGLAFRWIDKNYLETICISPLISMGWVMEWPLHRDNYTANFVGAPIPFTVQGWDQTWQLLNLHLGLGITYKCFTLDSEYILDVSPDGGSPFTNQRANFRFSLNF